MEDNSKEYQQLAEKYHLELLILFGSQVAKKNTKLSDVDMAFFSYKTLPPTEENNLHEELMAILKRGDLDLINIKNTPSPLLRCQIFMEGKPLYEKNPGKFDTMKWQAYFDFEDFKRFYKEKDKLIDKNIQDLLN